MTTSASSVPTMTSPRPTGVQQTAVPNSEWGMRKSASTSIPNPTRERARLLWVAILSIPSWLFVLLYAVYVPSVMSSQAMILDLGLVQALTWPGLLVACMTAGAFILTMAAKLRGSVSVKTQRIMWALTTLSLASCALSQAAFCPPEQE